MKKILIVDDNPSIREVMDIALGSEYKLFMAENGRVASQIIEKEKIDLIILDLVMPEMDGLEFYKYLKNTLKLTTPVIFLTGAVVKEGLNDKVWKDIFESEEFLSKPIDINILRNKIKKILKG